jgi:hypothetical protein
MLILILQKIVPINRLSQIITVSVTCNPQLPAARFDLADDE